MRNWVTPPRSQRSQASSGESGTGAASRSSTVTSCPSRWSIRAAASPHTPAPAITIRAMTSGRPERAEEAHDPLQPSVRPLLGEVEPLERDLALRVEHLPCEAQAAVVAVDAAGGDEPEARHACLEAADVLDQG